jgi:DNA helicase-2/ATP-dependent DNA helicase PcrA
VISPTELAAALNLPTPTEQQQRVIAAPLQPHIIIAGAGSGKTETIAGRVVWLVANGLVPPEEILGLTFTRKAAGELVERVGRRLRALRASGMLAEAETVTEVPAVPTIATYNSYAASLVRDHGLRVGVEPDSRLLGEAACWQLAYDLVERWNPHSAEVFEADSAMARQLSDAGLDVLDRATGTIVSAVLSLAGQCAEHLAEPGDIIDVVEAVTAHAASLPKDAAGGPPVPAASSQLAGVLGSLRARAALVPVVEAYRRRLRELEAMDFGDQVRVAAQLAALPDVAQGERRRFSAVLLDEFQDTSHAQLELLARLFGSGHPVTAVGDPNQSIYGWRGASSGNLAAFRQRFARSRKPAAVLDLTTSWRNPRAVLDVANHLAGELRQRSAVPVQELTPGPGAALGRVRVAWHQTSLDEAAWLAECLASRWDGATTAAVVCRRRAQFPLVEDALRQAGLPVEVVGIGGLLQRPEVADVIATLAVVADPDRPDALVRLLTGPRWQIGPRDLVALGAWSRELARKAGVTTQPVDPQADSTDGRSPAVPANLCEAVENLPASDWVSTAGHRLSDPARQRLTRLVDEIRRLREHCHLPLVELVAEAERTLMIEIELSVLAGGSPARAQLDEFAEVAAEFTDGTARPTLPAFLAWLAAAAERERGLERADDEPERPRERAGDQATPNAGVVQVLTVHAAKGLEWDVVAVPGLVEDRFPAGRRSAGRDSASGWPSTLGDLPFSLRGDAGALPVWNWRSATDLAQLSDSIPAFRWEYGEHEAQEERRLIYVAATRARDELLLSGFVWDRDVTRAREPSRYLREVCARKGVPGLEVPGEEVFDVIQSDRNPLSENPIRSEWPLTGRRGGLLEAAEVVRAAMTRAGRHAAPIEGRPRPDRPEHSAAEHSAAEHASTGHASAGQASAGQCAAERPPTDTNTEDTNTEYTNTECTNTECTNTEHTNTEHTNTEYTNTEGSTRPEYATNESDDVAGRDPVRRTDRLDRLAVDVERLLAERAMSRTPVTEVAMPATLSASQAVHLARDRDDFATALRRPMPVEPRAATRRGTSLHEWIERRLHSQALVDLTDLVGAGDDDLAPDADLTVLQVNFESSVWSQREVLATEIDIETTVSDTVLRGRIDAVFAAPRGDDPVLFDIVDWKTGSRPRGESARAALVQLAVYRLAWARLRGVPLQAVRASFCYLSTGETVTPTADLDEQLILGVLAG